MLTALLHADVGEVVAVATRYYGGIKLGTGGLSRAYSGGVVLALKSLPTEEKVERVPLFVTVGYSEVDAMQRLIVELDLVVVEEAYGSDVRYEIGVPLTHVETLRRRVADMTRGAGKVEAP